MSSESDDKKKLYNQVARANLHLVLERMRVHGFWPAGRGLPADPPDEVAARKAIDTEVETLKTTAFVGGPDAIEKALREERIRRWEESKKRRVENKKLRQAKLAERRAAWSEKKRGLLVHAGIGVSAGLAFTESDAERLAAHGLPFLKDASDLASAMEIDLSRLRFLTFHRRGATLVHYSRFTLPKKTGGVRRISAPKPKLARAQHWVLENILEKVATSNEAHGFVRGRSIVSNAKVHVGQRVVVNLDLKDFFPTLTFARVKGLFRSFGYSEHVATCLALLTTEPPRALVELDGAKTFVALGDRVLPQGACTSPAITNLVCRSLDRRLRGLGDKHGFSFTRYADDLTFSGPKDRATGRLLRSVRSILTAEGFCEHPTKTKVMRRGRRQEVTGVVVNTAPNLAREDLRELRAILHNARKTGLSAQNREALPNFAAHLRGRIAYVAMVNPERGARLKRDFDALAAEGKK